MILFRLWESVGVIVCDQIAAIGDENISIEVKFCDDEESGCHEKWMKYPSGYRIRSEMTNILSVHLIVVVRVD